MIILVKIVGILIMALGLMIFVSPEFTQKLFAFFKDGKKIYYAGVFRSVVGLILILGSGESLVPLAAIALGLMFLVSGIAVFASDTEKLKAFIESYSQMPALVIRLLGLVATSFGILVFAIF
ncbi:MAG TPA: DUF2065 family protein [Candidatus Omnitrophota bacterium]|nr:DUF2065 family protein [Candidatus Omnitrophota bacterium]HPD85404.1 DUF2065 family protein [Candidatus Omnitrophota bacterium]HRZ04095.1 DUF2065 family protein [Candidatus Omnitrophota bacterium]